MRATRPGYDQMHPPDVPPYPQRDDEPRIVHAWSDKDLSRMKCGLLRRSLIMGSRDIIDGKAATCLWCAVARY